MANGLSVNSLSDFIEKYNTEDKCIALFISKRWSNGVTCPYCLHDKVYIYSNGRQFKCIQCKTQFTYKSGTVFEYSKISMKKIFLAMHFVLTHTNGVSSYTVARNLDISQKAAFYLLQRIRKAFEQGFFRKPLDGVVESDDTYVGGLNKNRHGNKKVQNSQGRSNKSKVPIIGLLQRGGEFRAIAVTSMKGRYVTPFLVKNLAASASLMTDEWKGFRPLGAVFKHEFIVHAKKEYVRGDCHTNSIEGFWRLLKECVRATYHLRMHRKNMQKYLDEVSFRYNSRNFTTDEKFDLLFSRIVGRIRYKKL